MTEKLYYLKHKVVRFFDDDNLYLNYDCYNNNYSLGGHIGDERFQTTFTEKEIQINLDPAECFKLAIDDLEKCDIEG